jgi:Zn-dependent peptidase ImmA (M78 family)/transcriptional regulator with XRE-family HTH domain
VRSPAAPATSGVIEWAIEESGLSRDDLASAMGVERALVDAWADGSESPTVAQLTDLAHKVRRPFATFFLPAAPVPRARPVRFRGPLGSERRTATPDELNLIREAQRVQRILGWIGDELGEERAEFPNLPGTDSEQAGQRLRDFIGISDDPSAFTVAQYVRQWRIAIEARGIAVFFLPLGKDGSRGLALWDEAAPLIAVNTALRPEARLFTMLHEVAHIFCHSDSACRDVSIPDRADPEERWCEATAAAALMPRAECARVLSERWGWSEHGKAVGLDEATSLARHFHVSLRAAVLRLIDIGAATWALFKKIPVAADAKSRSGSGEGRDRLQARRDEFGERTLSLFARAARSDVISYGDVAAYLRVPPWDLEKAFAGARRTGPHRE